LNLPFAGSLPIRFKTEAHPSIISWGINAKRKEMKNEYPKISIHLFKGGEHTFLSFNNN